MPEAEKGKISEREKMEDGKRAMKNPVTKMAGFSMAMYMHIEKSRLFVSTWAFFLDSG